MYTMEKTKTTYKCQLFYGTDSDDIGGYGTYAQFEIQQLLIFVSPMLRINKYVLNL